METALADGLELITDHGSLILLGGWPDEVRLSSSLGPVLQEPRDEDLVDIQASNGRGIYRVRQAEDPRLFAYVGELVYSEVDGG